MRTPRWLVLVMCALGAGTALAAPPPAHPARLAPPAPPAPPAPAPALPAASDKVDAKALMQSDLKLFAAKDFLGALAVFKTAYTEDPRPEDPRKIPDRGCSAPEIYRRTHGRSAADEDAA